MPGVEPFCAALPQHLDEDDVLIDVASMDLDETDVARLVEELVVRRNAATLTLLGAPDHLVDVAKSLMAQVGCADRLRVDSTES